MNRTEVVVGVDGSAPSWDALRWAIGAATRRRSALRVMSAYRAPWPPEEAAGVDLDRTALASAEAVVAEMVAHARQAAPGTRVNGLAVCGSAASVLQAADGNAAALVVGSRSHGGLASLLLGATSLQVATHARVPVAVVRGRTDAAEGPVVVGTDGSAGADVAIGLAFEEAAERGCGLTAIRAYRTPVPPWAAMCSRWCTTPNGGARTSTPRWRSRSRRGGRSTPRWRWRRW
jgi:nucleotide-binding universal stress UspA family protein